MTGTDPFGILLGRVRFPHPAPIRMVPGQARQSITAQQTGAAAKPATPAPRTYTPQVRQLAADLGVDLSAVVGTGAGGRVRTADVLASFDAESERLYRLAWGDDGFTPTPAKPLPSVADEAVYRAAWPATPTLDHPGRTLS